MRSLKNWFIRERGVPGYWPRESKLTIRELLVRLFRDARPADALLSQENSLDLYLQNSTAVPRLPGLGPARLEQLRAALELGIRLQNRSNKKESLPAITCAADAFHLVCSNLSHAEVEYFVVLHLDPKLRVTHIQTVAQGTKTECLVHPREVFCEAVRQRAHSVIACHNHPSDTLEPSGQDLELTARLCRASDVLGIPLLDHLIIGKNSYLSMADLGFVSKVASKDYTMSCQAASSDYSKRIKWPSSRKK